MKNKLLYLVATIILLLTFQTSFAVEPRVIKVGAFNNYPVIFKDTDGVFKGLYVDILTEIGLKENIKFEYTLGTWNDGLNRIKSGEVDLLTSVGYSEERFTFMDYTINPILTVWGDLYAQQSSKLSSILEISGKKIGIMRGDINATNFRDLVSKFEIVCQFIEFENYDDVFSAVAEKRVDAGVAGITFGSSNEIKYGLKSTGIVFNPMNLYFTTAKGKNQDIIVTLDKYLALWKFQEDSFLNQAKLKWLYGSVGAITVIPTWVNEVLVSFVVLFIAAIIFITLLNIQVRRATSKIRQREEALRESEKKYHSIFDNFIDLYYQTDMKGNIITLSPSCYAISGWRPEELIGHQVLEFYPNPEERKALIEKLYKEGLVSNYRINLLHRDGRSLLASVSSHLVKDEQGNFKYVEGTIRDISEYKRSEDDLQKKYGEIEKMNKLMVDRELKMAELKEEIKTLKAKCENK